MTSKKNLAEVEKSETAHFDWLYSENIGVQKDLIVSEELIKKYENPSSRLIDWREYALYLLGDIKGKKLLDYGCGSGEDAVFLAKKGAIVAAFDISQEGVNLTRLRAKKNNVEDRIEASVMSGNKLDYGSEVFDAVFGSWVLHHLDLEAASSEVWRVLKTGGKAVFLEPVVNSTALNTLKHIVKKIIRSGNYIGIYDTEDEEPFNYEKIAMFGKKFKHVHYREFSLFVKLGAFFPHKTCMRMFQTMDYFFFKYLPFTRRFGTGVLIELHK